MVAEASTCILVPVLARPHRVEPLLASIWEATPEPHRVLFVAGRNDREELAAIRSAGADVLVVDCTPYPQRINAGYRASDDPWLFLAADDVVFHVGWLGEALRAAEAACADVVGTNDLGNERTVAGTHSTHTLVRRSYCDDPGGAWGQPGTVLHEGYRHWYCDDELVQVAQARGVWAHAGRSVVEHLHPYHGKGDGMDHTYRLGERRKTADAREFQRRLRLWT